MKNLFSLSLLAVVVLNNMSFSQRNPDSTKIVLTLTSILAQEPPPTNTMTLADFISYNNDLYESGQRFEGYSFNDLDADGVPELLLNLYSGGAHCCWELIALRETSPDTFTSVELFGKEYAKVVGNEIHESVMPDYFHTCHACWNRYDEPLDPWARYRYHQNRFYFSPAQRDIDSMPFVDELRRLSRLPIPALKAKFDQDGGQRAAFASVLLAYFYLSYDLSTVKRWFNEYYEADDKQQIWTELADLMRLDREIMR